MEQKAFVIKSYGKSELAMMYFPDAASKRSALKRLKYWFSINRELCRLNGSKNKLFTPLEVRRIVEVLGEPFGYESDAPF